MSKKDMSRLQGVIFCCHGGSCTRAGARTVEKALRLTAREHGLKSEVKFVRTACTGLCKSAPVAIACVNPRPEVQSSPETDAPGYASTCGAHWLLEVQAQDAPALFARHFVPDADIAKPAPQPSKKAKSPEKSKEPKKKPKKR